VIDLAGQELSPASQLHLDPGGRAFQYRPGVVRVIVPVKFVPTFSGDLRTESKNLAVELQAATLPVPPVKPVPDVPTAQLTLRPVGTAGTSTTLLLPLEQPAVGAVAEYLDPTTIEITVPGVRGVFAEGEGMNLPSVRSVSSRNDFLGLHITLRLDRPTAFVLRPESAGLSIQLTPTPVGDGSLAGKVIVVDPGHGGHDSGTTSAGFREKDIALRVGLRVAERLRAEGATVIITRDSDVFIPLMERSQISNRNHADFFISCHVNSTGGSGSQSGGITFHHKGHADSRLLAECIQHEIAKYSGIPSMGAWSDGKIYESGFSVLRNTEALAVLIETGFLNHPRDRKRLVTDDFPSAIAEGVVGGLKVYLGGGKK
jgi:N-acetylmuramoyl-L-alanine amidase